MPAQCGIRPRAYQREVGFAIFYSAHQLLRRPLVQANIHVGVQLAITFDQIRNQPGAERVHEIKAHGTSFGVHEAGYIVPA